MAMTNAAKQAAFRQRRDARIREMEGRLRNHSEAPKAVLSADERDEIARLRAEMAQDRRALEWAQDAIKMLKAQNKRLRTGADEEEPAGIDEAKLDRAHPEHREGLEEASAGVRTWLNSFAAMPRKDAKDAYQLFLCLTAIEALPMGKPKKPKAAPAPAKAEEPQQEAAALNWIDREDRSATGTPSGDYSVMANRGGLDGFGTFFKPRPGPRGGFRQTEALGNFPTLAEAKATCEAHARASAVT